MSHKTIIRRAEAEDLQGIAELAARSFRDTFAADNDPENIEDYLQSSLTLESMREDFLNKGNIFLCAFRSDDALPIGYAKLCTMSDDPSITGQNTLEIERIYADQRFIGQGVGAALMRACLNEAADLECDTIWLGVWEHNTRAILFYKRWQFETVGTRSFAMGSELQNDLLMARTYQSRELSKC